MGGGGEGRGNVGGWCDGKGGSGIVIVVGVVVAVEEEQFVLRGVGVEERHGETHGWWDWVSWVVLQG